MHKHLKIVESLKKHYLCKANNLDPMFNFFFRNTKPLPELFFHTDMHCHLIPGIDDGQQMVSGGAELVEKELSWGIEKILCTPHITEDKFENTPEIISDAFQKLQTELHKRELNICIDYSAEHRLDGFFLSELEKGNIRPLPNNYLLVENPFMQEAWDFDNRLFELNVRGYRPVLAHPERYPYYFNKPERYEQIHAAGTLFQLNLLSLAGYYGKEVKRVAEMLVNNNLVDFIGTDIHNTDYANAIDRYIASREYKLHRKQLEHKILNDKEL